MVLKALLHDHRAPWGSVDILVTTDEGIRTLNREFRGLDEATDVLAFPSPNVALGHIGDLAISHETAQRQATAHGVTTDHELVILAIHGGLHLLGWDDQSDDERAAMSREMQRVGDQVGHALPDGWGSLHPEEGGA